jgi:hypothetical protein
LCYISSIAQEPPPVCLVLCVIYSIICHLCSCFSCCE